jgi:hypothetical protein
MEKLSFKIVEELEELNVNAQRVALAIAPPLDSIYNKAMGYGYITESNKKLCYIGMLGVLKTHKKVGSLEELVYETWPDIDRKAMLFILNTLFTMNECKIFGIKYIRDILLNKINE